MPYDQTSPHMLSMGPFHQMLTSWYSSQNYLCSKTYPPGYCAKSLHPLFLHDPSDPFVETCWPVHCDANDESLNDAVAC